MLAGLVQEDDGNSYMRGCNGNTMEGGEDFQDANDEIVQEQLGFCAHGLEFVE